jgi:predicted anti-sigma-YlaC factor YlaD
MHCRNARKWLSAQRDEGLELSLALQEHLRECEACHMLAQHQHSLDSLLRTQPPQLSLQKSALSTAQIMSAVQLQKRITQQLEDIRRQQQTRVESMKKIGITGLAGTVFVLSCVPLIVLTISLLQTDFMVSAVSTLSNTIDIFIILAQYLQTGLTLFTRNNWVLSGGAFAVVVMMGMWLRLMRPPQEA